MRPKTPSAAAAAVPKAPEAPQEPKLPDCAREPKETPEQEAALDARALKLANASIARIRVIPAEKVPNLTAKIEERTQSGTEASMEAYGKAFKGAERAIERLRDPKMKATVKDGKLTLTDGAGKVFFSSTKFGRGIRQFGQSVPEDEMFSDILIYRGAGDLTLNQGTRDLLGALDLREALSVTSGKPPLTPSGAFQIEKLVGKMNSPIPECNYLDVTDQDFRGEVRPKLNFFLGEEREAAPGGDGSQSDTVLANDGS